MTRRKHEVEVELERTQRDLREAKASVADMCRGREHLTQQLGVLRVRAERAEAQLAALRADVATLVEALQSVELVGVVRSEDEARLEGIITLLGSRRDGAALAPAAEAHDRRVRAETLREAAEALGGRMQVDDEVGEWLRARADEIERARAERAEGQRDEMRALLATAIDVITLPGHAFARSAWDQACLLAGRYSDENLRHDFGKLARAERAEGQLAALRVAARETLIAYGGEGDPLGAALEAALDDGAQAAEAHDRRVRAEALREAAEALGGRMQVDDEVGEWLRARADETERGPQEPESPVYDPGPCPLCVPGTPPGSSDALCFGHRENFRVFLSEKA
jgi:hypothetical protein